MKEAQAKEAQEAVSPTVRQSQEHVQRTSELLQQTDYGAVSRLVDKLYDAYQAGSRVFIFGNGGSAATASHMAEDLAKSTVKDMGVPRRLRVSSLTDSVPFLSALGNDWGFEFVFREQLVTNASAGDVAIGISGSGNSPNILSAMKWARDNGLFTCGLTGFNGGKLKGMVDLSLHYPVLDMEIAENCHMVVCHLIVGGLRARINAA